MVTSGIPELSARDQRYHPFHTHVYVYGFEDAEMGQSFFHDPARLALPRTERVELAGGAFVLRSPEPLQPYARCIGEWIEHWARETPDQVALAERLPDGQWREVRYGELRRTVGAAAQGLLDLGLPAGRPVVVLSDNAVDHALLMLAAMHVGRAVCTVSSAYSRLTKDFTKIGAILRTLQPGNRLSNKPVTPAEWKAVMQLLESA